MVDKITQRKLDLYIIMLSVTGIAKKTRFDC